MPYRRDNSKRPAFSGFTLAELLISMAVLGVISTFTLSKVLISSQSSRNNAIAKEDAAMVAAAYQMHQYSGLAGSGTTFADLIQYMNYVKIDSSSSVNDRTLGSPVACSTFPCVRLHNGSVIYYNAGISFGGTSGTNVIWFNVDPDGQYNSVAAVGFFLTYPGRLLSYGTNTTTLFSNANFYTAAPDPVWFSF